jgi:rfaE bifunctional protein nucleotidyltransferase chain/domain
LIRDKILPPGELAERLARERQSGRKVVFTNGCFDILHAGHALLLEQAHALGDLLVVGLNSDASVRGIKGPGRPVNEETRRATVLAALAAVDYVALFEEPTPLELIRILRPDILVKGSDWAEQGVVGQSDVESWGGRVVLLPLVEGLSTTALIGKLKDSGGMK